MIRSVVLNKQKIRAMCESEDEECKALRGKDLSDEQWQIMEVCLDD
jgi:hypothetical protein